MIYIHKGLQCYAASNISCVKEIWSYKDSFWFRRGQFTYMPFFALNLKVSPVQVSPGQQNPGRPPSHTWPSPLSRKCF